MRMMIGAFFALLLATAANAQTDGRSTPVPTPGYAPFSSDWAKPFPQTGGYIYNDPRLRPYQQPLRPGRLTGCPPGLVLDRTSGSCF
jgi:hypothetical protein